jgi:hypothetical protein
MATRTAAQQHVEGDRDQHHVAERVGEADRRREETAVTGRIDLVENDDPAAEEHGSRDHHPVDHRPDAPGEGRHDAPSAVRGAVVSHTPSA